MLGRAETNIVFWIFLSVYNDFSNLCIIFHVQVCLYLFYQNQILLAIK